MPLPIQASQGVCARRVQRDPTVTSVRAEMARLVAPGQAAATSSITEHRMSGSALAFLMASDRHQALPRARAAGRVRGTHSREGSAHDRVRCSRSRTTTSRSGARELGTPGSRGVGLAEGDQTPDAKRRVGARTTVAKPWDRARTAPLLARGGRAVTRSDGRRLGSSELELLHGSLGGRRSRPGRRPTTR